MPKSGSGGRVLSHNDQIDQARLSQNGDILLKWTLQTYSCSPASFLAIRKCQQVTRKVLRKNTHKTAPLSSKSTLLFCDRGASLCNPGLLAGEFNVSIQKCMVPPDGPNPSQSEGGHLEGTQPEGEWIPQDSQGPTHVPTTSRGCNFAGGRFIGSTQLSRWQLSLSRFLKQCPRSHPSGYLPKMMTALSLLPPVGGPLASLWGNQRVESTWRTLNNKEVQICGQED